jgi:hypothetical protein
MADDSQPFDPLLAQAERLPSFLKGTDGDQPHVRDVDGEGNEVQVDPDDEPFGGEGIGDPSKLTAD